jgi:hypothetical protein
MIYIWDKLILTFIFQKDYKKWKIVKDHSKKNISKINCQLDELNFIVINMSGELDKQTKLLDEIDRDVTIYNE